MSARSIVHGDARSDLHDERLAAVLGILLGVAFVVCFVTGLLSHLVQRPPGWFEWPSRPAGLYRVTQGLHVTAGVAAVPLLLAKLWVVAPKLLERPAFAGLAHAVERVSLVPLVGGGLFQLWSGIANAAQWYPWPFGFRASHYAIAWVTIGGLVAHVGAKWCTTRRALARPARRDPATGDRRAFLGSVLATSALLAVFSVGQSVHALRRLALLAPRRPDVGVQGFPVNRTAHAARVVEVAQDPGFRLVVDGNVQRTLSLSSDDLLAMPQHEATLPISCVEGWSTSQRWRGVRMRDLLDLVGAEPDAEVVVRSLEANRSSRLNRSHAHDVDTLLALAVNGETLDLDHGYPVRLIGPNRPGTMQTKWVTRVEVV